MYGVMCVAHLFLPLVVLPGVVSVPYIVWCSVRQDHASVHAITKFACVVLLKVRSSGNTFCVVCCLKVRNSTHIRRTGSSCVCLLLNLAAGVESIVLLYKSRKLKYIRVMSVLYMKVRHCDTCP